MALSEEVAERLSEELPQAIMQKIAELDSQRMVTRQLVIIESITGDGERTLSFFPGPDSRAWDLYGMLKYVETRVDALVKDGGF